MARKNESEAERQKVREATAEGKRPSEAGATQGASDQNAATSRGGHPKQETTDPVRR